ncbi:MAG TPA: DnaJ domain-containing protein [Acetobacteraceae bacterium]|nr:DnaJ domain-containing protein [Acetobacteraceae bacterium]
MPAQITSMLWFALGALTLFLFLGGLRAFEQASISTIKSLLLWIAALGGLTLALLLVLTGRGVVALGALAMFGPLLWNRWRASQLFKTGFFGSPGAGGPGGSSGSGAGGSSGSPRPRAGAMSTQEAYQVLGLPPGATEADIRAAHHRLMRTAHPDAGGSDWLAARINMARDVLLGGKHA